jgi:hypothetical protein
MKGVAFFVFGMFLTEAAMAGSDEYIRKLSETVRASDAIVVTEHSFEMDLFDRKTMTSLLPGELVYRAVTLTENQRHMVERTIERLDPKTQDVFPACAFEPHHSVRFFSRRGACPVLCKSASSVAK